MFVLFSFFFNYGEIDFIERIKLTYSCRNIILSILYCGISLPFLFRLFTTLYITYLTFDRDFICLHPLEGNTGPSLFTIRNENGRRGFWSVPVLPVLWGLPSISRKKKWNQLIWFPHASIAIAGSRAQSWSELTTFAGGFHRIWLQVRVS